jgi:hypothetical protein
MPEVLPMPRLGDVFADVRGGGRTMRVSYHGDERAVVVSLWVGTVCRATFRMAASDLSTLMSTLGEINLAVDSTATTSPGRRDSTSGPAGLDSEAAAVAGAHEPSGTPIVQTGEMARTADTGLPAPAPVVRVA